MKGSKVKLNIGCGPKPKEGYVGVDVNPKVNPDIVAPASMIPLDDNSVSEIYARHFIEHLTPYDFLETLKEWDRLLTTHGEIHLIFPNLAYHCKQLFKPGISPFVPQTNFFHACSSIFGWTGNVTKKPNDFMSHKWGYTPKSFKALITTNTKFKPPKSF